MFEENIWYLWNLITSRLRVYLSYIPNFILIEHRRAEIQSRKFNREVWRKNWYYVTVTLTFDPRSPISIGFDPVRKTASKSVHLLGWNFVHKQSRTDRYTDRQTHTQTNRPRFCGGVKNWVNMRNLLIFMCHTTGLTRKSILYRSQITTTRKFMHSSRHQVSIS